MDLGPWGRSHFREAFLSRMVEEVRREIADGFYDQRPAESILPLLAPPRLSRALSRPSDGPALIVEYKPISPGYGDESAADLDPIRFLRSCDEAGVEALSVIPQPFRFGGDLQTFGEIAALTSRPVLFKDFVIGRRQIGAARAWGASAVLLLARLEELGGLEEPLADLVGAAHECGLEALVEVHTPEEVPLALGSRPDVLGVNARDLQTLDLNPASALPALRRLAGGGIPLVGMSGIQGPEEARLYRGAGADALLVGTGFARAPDRTAFLRSLRTSSEASEGRP